MRPIYFKKMTTALLIMAAVGMSSAHADDYCNGYEAGYKIGYKDTIRSPLDPMVPICTLPPISQLDQPERNYRDGYKQGYKEGTQKAKEQ